MHFPELLAHETKTSKAPKVNFYSVALKALMGHTVKTQSWISKFAVIYTNCFETWCFVGHKHWVRICDWVPRYELPPSCLPHQLGSPHSAVLTALLQAKLEGHRRGKKPITRQYDYTFFFFFPQTPANSRDDTHWLAAAHIQQWYYASQSHPNYMNN